MEIRQRVVNVLKSVPLEEVVKLPKHLHDSVCLLQGQEYTAVSVSDDVLLQSHPFDIGLDFLFLYFLSEHSVMLVCRKRIRLVFISVKLVEQILDSVVASPSELKFSNIVRNFVNVLLA